MAYPSNLIYDYYANRLSDDFGVENIGTPKFEITDDSDETTGYRFATSNRQGCCYIKFDRGEA